MNSRIDTDKIDYSEGADILKELYNGKRQCIECKWEDFFDIPVNEGYKKRQNRDGENVNMCDEKPVFIKTKDMSNNSIPVINDNTPTNQ